MRKVNVIFIILTVFFLVLNGVQFFLWKNVRDDITEKSNNTITELSAELASYGDPVTVYTVKSAVKAGDEITEENIELRNTYTSMVTDQYVTDISSILGKLYKVSITPGTPVLYSMIMDEKLDDTMRDRDIVLDHYTVGLQPGDYIDIRITLPYGDDYIVLSHKRVYEINESSIKLYMTEYEWNVYQGAMVDYFLNEEYGCSIYADRYVEPGIQNEAQAFYAVPKNIAALLQKNPNIVDKEAAGSLNAWRESIEGILVLFRTAEDTIDVDAGKFSAGRSAISSNIETDRAARAAEELAEQEEQQRQEEEAATDAEYWTETGTTETEPETESESDATPDENSDSLSPTEGGE